MISLNPTRRIFDEDKWHGIMSYNTVELMVKPVELGLIEKLKLEEFVSNFYIGS